MFPCREVIFWSCFTASSRRQQNLSKNAVFRGGASSQLRRPALGTSFLARFFFGTSFSSSFTNEAFTVFFAFDQNNINREKKLWVIFSKLAQAEPQATEWPKNAVFPNRRPVREFFGAVLEHSSSFKAWCFPAGR